MIRFVSLAAFGALWIVSAANLFALAPGDNLSAFWKAQASKYSSSRALKPLEGWPGYETAVLATDPGFTHPPFVLVVRSKSGVVVPFGSVEGTAGQALLVLDTHGDGKLDFKTTKNLIPGWLALKVPGHRGTGKEFRNLMDRIYHQYDQNSGPIPAQLSLLVQTLKARVVDESNLDRDLAEALTSALDQAIAEPALAAGTLWALSAALKPRGGDHPLVALYQGEALAALGRDEEAQDTFDRLLVLDAKSTIGAFKKAQTKPAALSSFRKLHPDFWASRE